METDSPRPIAPGPNGVAPRGDRALPLVLLIALAIVAGFLIANRPVDVPAGPHASQAANADEDWTPTPVPEGETVSLAIDFGNGARRELTLPWTKNMTIGDLMQAARDFRPAVAFTQKGDGKMAFLTSLEGVRNEGAQGRYWLYSVDGQRGEVSFAVQPLQPGAAVLWEFRRGE